MKIPPDSPYPPGGQALVESILAARRSLSSVAAVADEDGRLMGPFSCLPHSPDLGDALQRVGTAIRTGSILDRVVTEAVILTVARHWRADYEWYAHTAIARDEGLLDDEQLALIKAGRRGLAHPAADLAAEFVRCLLSQREAPAELEQELVRVTSVREVVEIVMVCGYYSALALLIRAFETPLPDGVVAQI